MTRVAHVQRGARFYKCALQVNPHHYRETFRGQPSDGDATAHAMEVIAKAVDLNIEALAVTDHNSVRDVATFRAAAENQPVHIIPGFELSSSEGVHVLCLYPLDTSDDRLERYLGEFGIRDTDPSSDIADKSFSQTLSVVQSQGGLAIAAHVTNDRGLLKVMRGQSGIRAWQDENLLAVQIPGPVSDLPSHIRPIVENRNADYRRAQAPEERLALAVLNAKDVTTPKDLEDPAATCLIKMDDVGIGGLRQAFLDPGSRIRLNWDIAEQEHDEHMELLELGWKGGFLDGVTVSLNPNLNVLIGGRGAGKSTVVESIRSVLGLEPVGDDARKAHDGILRQVLRSGTKISLRVQVRRPGPRVYRLERTIPNPPLVREESGEVSHLAPTDVLPKVEVYGQHEISELTKSPDKLTRLLDRFVEHDESLDRRRASLRGDLAKNRRALCDVRAEIDSDEDRLDALPGLEETLRRFREAGLEERLKEQSLLVREERVLRSVPQRMAPFREALDTFRRELPIDRSFLSEKAIEELPAKEVFARANQVLAELDGDLADVSGKLNEALEHAAEEFERVNADWRLRKRQVQAQYERILRELQRSSVDGEEFIRLRRQIEELRPLQERLALRRRLEREHEDHRRTLLAEWEDAKASEFHGLDRAARKVNKRLRDRVQAEVRSGGDREPLFELLRKNVGGRLSEAVERLRSLPELSLTQFVDACRSGGETVQKTYGIPSGQAERLAKAKPEILMHIEELELGSTTAISLNTAPAGAPPSWQALDDLSTGQKATAVLLLLLLESDAPLIVDQPEDDLDNRFITEGVVPRMRAEKQRRQFIFSTHNANIPVLGDAELILGLSATGDAEGGLARIEPQHRGSIDSRPVRELVEELLEGGKDAFETRRRKYGF